MSVNSVGSATAANAYQTYAAAANTQSSEKTTSEDAKKTAAEESGAVYEPSKETTTAKEAKIYKPNTELVNKLKADAEARTSQMRSLVEQMISKQGSAYGTANDIWKFLASGKYTVDAATKAQAQADIAEDGYWGVNQTSDRIIDFAKALTGGDPDQIEKMRAAFEKGFKKATGAWGKDLPDISQRTYDAVMEKFDKMAEEAKKANEAADPGK